MRNRKPPVSGADSSVDRLGCRFLDLDTEFREKPGDDVGAGGGFGVHEIILRVERIIFVMVQVQPRFAVCRAGAVFTRSIYHKEIVTFRDFALGLGEQPLQVTRYFFFVAEYCLSTQGAHQVY